MEAGGALFRGGLLRERLALDPNNCMTVVVMMVVGEYQGVIRRDLIYEILCPFLHLVDDLGCGLTRGFFCGFVRGGRLLG